MPKLGGFLTKIASVSPIEAWNILVNHAESILIDVRTRAEWHFVGVPNLSPIEKAVQMIEWTKGDGTPNGDFIHQVQSIIPQSNTSLLFLCRSGVRSHHAAQEMCQRHQGRCYNILEGFEGTLDTDGHRGTVGGWKFHGLPWLQQ